MKYRLKVDKLTAELIYEKNPCKDEFKKVVEKFNFYDEINWEENEEFIINQNGWIEWLLDKGFIEKNLEKIKFDEDKIYVFNWVGNLSKICRINKNIFDVVCISDTKMYSGTKKYYTSTGQECLDKLLSDNRDVKEFDNILEAVQWFESTK